MSLIMNINDNAIPISGNLSDSVSYMLPTDRVLTHSFNYENTCSENFLTEDLKSSDDCYFVKVCSELGKEEVDLFELPLEIDGSLMLSTLNSVYANANGLLRYCPISSVDCMPHDIKIENGGYSPRQILEIIKSQDGRIKAQSRSSNNKNEEFDNSIGLKSQYSTGFRQDAIYYCYFSDNSKRCIDLIVLGMAWSTNEDSMKNYFENNFGELDMVQVKRAHRTGHSNESEQSQQSKGYGFIRFVNYTDQVICLSRNKHNIDGRLCEVKIPQSKIYLAKIEASRKIYVGGLTESISKSALTETFSKYGQVTDVFIPKPFRNFAFITFSDASTAKSLLNRQIAIGSTTLCVNAASPKSMTPQFFNLQQNQNEIFPIGRGASVGHFDNNMGSAGLAGSNCLPQSFQRRKILNEYLMSRFYRPLEYFNSGGGGGGGASGGPNSSSHATHLNSTSANGLANHSIGFNPKPGHLHTQQQSHGHNHLPASSTNHGFRHDSWPMSTSINAAEAAAAAAFCHQFAAANPSQCGPASGLVGGHPASVASNCATEIRNQSANWFPGAGSTAAIGQHSGSTASSQASSQTALGGHGRFASGGVMLPQSVGNGGFLGSSEAAGTAGNAGGFYNHSSAYNGGNSMDPAGVDATSLNSAAIVLVALNLLKNPQIFNALVSGNQHPHSHSQHQPALPMPGSLSSAPAMIGQPATLQPVPLQQQPQPSSQTVVSSSSNVLTAAGGSAVSLSSLSSQQTFGLKNAPFAVAANNNNNPCQVTAGFPSSGLGSISSGSSMPFLKTLPTQQDSAKLSSAAIVSSAVAASNNFVDSSADKKSYE